MTIANKKVEPLIKEIKNQLVKQFDVEKIILFGSMAKGVISEVSDIDICVVADSQNKRSTLSDMYCALDYNIPIDILLYTPKEWERCSKDQSTLAFAINSEGDLLYGR